MDDNTRAVIGSNARHAAEELLAIVDGGDEPLMIWRSAAAARTRIASIETLLTEAGHPRPPDEEIL